MHGSLAELPCKHPLIDAFGPRITKIKHFSIETTGSLYFVTELSHFKLDQRTA
jgi:hypothetical protein